MGAGVSDWKLARAVSSVGQIGVVSGTALDVILARRLQAGDLGGHMRRALAAFPDQGIAARLIDRYFVSDGKASDRPFANKPMVGDKPGRHLRELLVAANFAEVFLAKEGHDGMVGINYLHKIQAPLLASLYGAMLATVDIVIVGAGIPLEIPKILDGLCQCEPVDMELHVRNAERGRTHRLSFNPKDVLGDSAPFPARPRFFPIVASTTLASLMVKKCQGKVDGLIIEGPTAGGHNAPPRGRTQLNSDGEPIYGPRDEVDLKAVTALGVPYFLAGAYGTPEQLGMARAAGAAGIQVGTLFAFCEESGLRTDLKSDTIARSQKEIPRVVTDPIASPTGFPFKVLSIAETLSEPAVYEDRCRVCDLGYLREAYERADGTLGWRCSAEPEDDFVSKGGLSEETKGRKCLCNALMANIGLEQVRSDNTEELPLVTCGDELAGIPKVLKPGEQSYPASDVIDFLLADTKDA